MKLTRIDVIGDLKQQSGEAPVAQRRRWWPRHPLVVAQIALSLGLLSAAGLFVRGAIKAGNVDTGFNAENTVLAEVDASLAGYDQARSLPLYHAINDRLAALPGVQASSISSIVPFGTISMEHNVRRAGIAVAPDAHPATAAEGLSVSARWTSVGADYFTAMSLPLLRGRPFHAAEADIAGAPSVAIIDDVLAKKLFPDGDPLGERVQWADRESPSGPDAKTVEIVGIVPATRWNLFKEPKGAIYVPFAQGFHSNAFFHIRTAAPLPAGDHAFFELIRREIREVAPALPLFSVKTFPQHLDTSVQLWIVRTGATLFGIFGAIALLLAVVGIYGVKAYAVSRRTREIGIRMALGAQPGTVQRMILREGVAMTATGVALGLALGLAVGQACASLLYDVSAVDPLTFVLAPLVLATAALAACWWPARRATRISPMTALRAE